MNYRVGTVEDWPAIVQFLLDTEYFLPVDPGDIGGRWFVAESEEGVEGCIWFFGEQPNVYIDYFAAASPMVAARLMAKTEAVLKAHGVRFVRAAIPVDNKPMMRLAHWFGMDTMLDYTNVFKEIK